MILLRSFCNYLSIAMVICLSTILTTTTVAEVELVNVVFRHGDRTPDIQYETYPNDPFKNYSFFPTGLGHLTLDGKMREYKLGVNLRRRYANHLGSVYIPKHVVARSSEYDRTKMSLQLVLASLYPPAKVQRWNRRLNWQPIPTSYTPRNEDKLLLPFLCPEYKEEFEKVLQTPEVQKTMASFNDLKQNLTRLTGKPIEKPFDFFSLYHTFMAEHSLGLPLPNWAYDYFPYGPLFDATVASYDIFSKTDQLKKYYAGPLIGTMTKNMRATQNCASSAKIYLYSGHEVNVAALLHAFGVYEPHVPEYSSAIIIELQKIDSNYYVKLLYYKGIPPVFKELKISGCEILCPFDKFVELTANLIPTDEEFVCNQRKTPN